MQTRYFGKHEMRRCLEGKDLADDLRTNLSIGISSIADLIEICDHYKRNNKSGFVEQLTELKESHLKNGVVYISELDQQMLLSTLFDNENEEITLWPDGSNRATSPIHSVRCLTLRVSDSVFWGAEVYQDMLELLHQ